MSIKEFDAEDELDDAFEAFMEWEERKTSLEYDIKRCENQILLCEDELRDAKEELEEAEKELQEHLDNKPE